MNWKQLQPYFILVSIAMVLFLPFLGAVPLFDWDEANFAEAAREMVKTGDYMRVYIDFMPFWEKPPVFIWMQAFSMKLFGINEFAARFPNAIIGAFTLCCLYFIGNKVSHNKLGKWWVGLYLASWLPHFYFKTAIIDPTFNIFIFLAVYQVYALQYAQKAWKHSVFAGVWLGLAVLTKGPAAILICLLTLGVYLLMNKFKTGIRLQHLLYISLACFITTFTWFGIDIVQNGWWFTQEFIIYQIRLFSTEDAGHGGPFYYHWVVLLFGCFPAAAFLFQYLKQQKQVLVLAPERTFSQLMWALFGVVLILFSIVKTKIVHYSSMCYLPLTFLAARQLQWWYEGKKDMWRVSSFVFLVTGILVCVLIAALPIVGVNIQSLTPYIKDDFALGNIQANVTWNYTQSIWGLLAIAGMVYAFYRMKKDDVWKGFRMLVASQVLIIFVTMVVFIPKIEQYSQHAAIDFYKQAATENAIIHPLGFKSYAYLFYSQKQAISDTMYYHDRTKYLMQAPLEQKVYFVSKNIFKDIALATEALEVVTERNGYVLYKRKDQ
jgi:4-amino-4-deoxy-L-arabinose transferase-like glycosyltransferase